MHYLGLELKCDHYYIKRSQIVDRIVFQNRTFYAKFERIDRKLTDTILHQHITKEYTIAIPIVCNNKCTYEVLDYKGEEARRFAAVAKMVLEELEETGHLLLAGRDKDRVKIFLDAKQRSVQEASDHISQISKKIEKLMTKRWKHLPSVDLPQDYNIATLPYGVYDLFP